MRLFTVFHLNIGFSSIEESLRPEVVTKCYWPLLRLVDESALRAGIEAPAYTLEIVDAVDPRWTAKLRDLIARRKVEFVGSGYAQLIGPLVPSEVNAANLRIGNARYEKLLGARPRVALVNEQAYSSGLVVHYLDAGYQALVMEWNNAARGHPEWPRSARLAPAIAADQHGRTIPLLWNDSVAFQKFQRYAHGETELADALRFLGAQATPDAQAFCLYGNDVEIFDFRPGRFATEARIDGSEWTRIRALVDAITADNRFAFALPGEVLAVCPPKADAVFRLESAQAPVLVKKQPKYNLTRWAVTGRDDLGVNSACWRMYETLMSDSKTTDDAWKELCYLWSSDFRTHITATRWEAYRKRLGLAAQSGSRSLAPAPGRALEADDKRVTRERRRWTVRAGGVEAVLNLRRGLALDRLVFPKVSPDPLAGNIEHGTLDDIALSADWYTGNLVLETPGAHKVTDLEPARDIEAFESANGGVLITATIDTRLGPIRKSLRFDAGGVELRYRLDWPDMPLGSLRLGFVTLATDTFDPKTLYYRTHSGGPDAETFPLTDVVVEHGAPVSFLVSASHALGLTKGIIDIGDATCTLRVEVDKGSAALIGMVTHRRAGDSTFCQVQFSAMELDDTSLAGAGASRTPVNVSLRFSGRRTTRDS